MARYILGNSDVPESLAGAQFCREILAKVNKNEQFAEYAADANAAFARAAKKVIESGSTCLAGDLLYATRNIPRYAYIKCVNFCGTDYDVEIDSLLQRINIISI